MTMKLNNTPCPWCYKVTRFFCRKICRRFIHDEAEEIYGSNDEVIAGVEAFIKENSHEGNILNGPIQEAVNNFISDLSSKAIIFKDHSNITIEIALDEKGNSSYSVVGATKNSNVINEEVK